MHEGSLPEPLDRWLEEEDARVSDLVTTPSGYRALHIDDVRRRLLTRARLAHGGYRPRKPPDG
jgi:hypothetical protein